MEKISLRLDLFDAYTQTTALNTEGNDLSGEMRTYYEKRLIDNAEPSLVHDQFADKYPIPKNGGKTIEFRKYASLPKALNAITEGTTPAGNKLSVTKITATVSQYGDYVQLSDMLEMAAVDRNVEQATKLLGASAGRTLDTITREELNGGTQVMYAPKKESGGTYTEVTSRSGITDACKLTPDMVFRAAAQLKSMNATAIDDCYVAIIHPYVAYDLMRNEEWLDAHKYADAVSIYMGEIGKLGQVRFVETTEAKIWTSGEIVPGVCKCTLKTALDATGSTDIYPDITISAAQAQSVSTQISAGTKVRIYVGGTLCEVQSVIAGESGTCKLTVSEAVKSKAQGAQIAGFGAGAEGSAVFSTLFIGSNAYGTTEIEGGGLEHIVKQLGYGEDPLNQRSAVGWKATKAAKRLVENYMLRVESGSSFSGKAVSN